MRAGPRHPQHQRAGRDRGTSRAAGGSGVGTRFPPLAGQSAAYIAAQLENWQAGGRPPGPLGLMEAIARKLKEQDIQAVSEYYAGLVAPAAGHADALGGVRAHERRRCRRAV